MRVLWALIALAYPMSRDCQAHGQNPNKIYPVHWQFVMYDDSALRKPQSCEIVTSLNPRHIAFFPPSNCQFPSHVVVLA